jgi:hypothetical protein
MTVPATRRRSRAGRFLIGAGVGLFSPWAYYFLNLVRPADAWDFSPLPVALGAILIGIRRARLDVRLPAMIGVSYRRDLAIALVTGMLVELILWLLTGPDPERAARYSQLARLQEPGVRIGLAVYKQSYSHLGRTLSLWIAELFVFLVLIAIWSTGAFALFCILRFVRNASSRVR